MASNLKIAAAAANAAVVAVAALTNGGKLQVYDGAQPATADTAVTTQNKLAEFTLPNPAFGSATAGVVTANAISDVTVTTGGTPAWFRVVGSGAADVLDGSAGTSATDLILNSSPLVLGADVSVTSWTLTEPEHA